MIPLRDSIPRVHKPYAVYALILINAAVFVFLLTLPADELRYYYFLLGVVPARFSNPEWAAAVGFPDGGMYTYLTYMFMHGGWLHFLLNMWTLWIFADNIEDVMGSGRFLVFYTFCGFAALGVHMLFNMNSPMPIIGASGAIGGVMGAYFLLYPHSKVLLLVPIFFIPWIFEVPAVIFLGIWFISQFWSGMSTMGAQAGQSVAWWAHAGGFVAGMALLPLFKQQKRCYHCYERTSGQVDGRRKWTKPTEK